MAETQDEWIDQFLRNIGLSPEWTYRKGVNEISLRTPRSWHSSELMLIASLALTVVLGMLDSVLPQDFAQVLTSVFSSVSSAFTRLLNTFSGMMIFLCIINGICGIDNVKDFTKIGRKMICRYIAYTFVCTVFGVFVFFLVYNITLGQAHGGKNQTSEVFKLIFNILPENPIKPFWELNTLQIAALAVFLGFLMLINADRMTTARAFFQECSILAGDSIRVICKLLPLYIISSLTLVFWESGYSILLKLWHPILFTTVFVLFVSIVTTIYICLRLKVSPIVLVRKLLPCAIIGLTTASSMVAFSTVLETCEKKLGIAPKYARVAIPLGHLAFNAPYTCVFVVPCFYLASYYNIEVDVIWLAQLVLLSILLTMSIPPIPGTFLVCLTILFNQLNIPSEGLSIAITLGMLSDFILTAGRIYQNQLEILSQAKSNNLLDMEILRRP